MAFCLCPRHGRRYSRWCGACEAFACPECDCTAAHSARDLASFLERAVRHGTRAAWRAYVQDIAARMGVLAERAAAIGSDISILTRLLGAPNFDEACGASHADVQHNYAAALYILRLANLFAYLPKYADISVFADDGVAGKLNTPPTRAALETMLAALKRKHADIAELSQCYDALKAEKEGRTVLLLAAYRLEQSPLLCTRTGHGADDRVAQLQHRVAELEAQVACANAQCLGMLAAMPLAVDDRGFCQVEDAVAAAPDDGVVTLQRDLPLLVSLSVGKRVAVCLNGHAIERRDRAATWSIADGARLEIRGPGVLRGMCARGGVLLANKGALLLRDLTVEGHDCGERLIQSEGELAAERCAFVGNVGHGAGGVIGCRGGTCRLAACRFAGNRARTAAVVQSVGASVVVEGCRFTENASAHGGVVDNNTGGTLSIAGSTFADNSGVDGPACVCNFCALSATKCTFERNATGGGGALNNQRGTCTLSDCVFSRNEAGRGGALYNEGTAALTGCTLSDNRAAKGGAVYNRGGHVRLSASGLEGNSADVGGALLSRGGTAAVTGCTLSGNRAGGASAAVHGVSGDVVMAENRMAGNTPGDALGLRAAAVPSPGRGGCRGDE